MSLRVAVFASGSGSNLQAILDFHARLLQPCWHVALVVSDQPGAGALGRAEAAKIQTKVVAVVDRPREELEAEMLGLLKGAGVGFVALAGYLRLIPAGIVQEYRERMVNIHPALLPAFGGKGMYGHRVHEAVLAAGARVTGPTVHWVDEAYDQGTIIAQWPVPVQLGDTAATLAARVLKVEHLLYPRVVDELCVVRAGRCRSSVFKPMGAGFVPAPTNTDDIKHAITDSFRRYVAGCSSRSSTERT